MRLSRAPSRCCLQLPTMIASMTCVVLAWTVQWSESTYTVGYHHYYDDDDDVEVNGLCIGSNVFLMVVILFYLAELIHSLACNCKNPYQRLDGWLDA
jgi:hypothetical protein